MLERWTLGVLERWTLGVLERWTLGVLEHWTLGVCLSRRSSQPRQIRLRTS